MSMPTRGVLLAAGEGTRCWPLTQTRPKPLLPVGDESLLGRLVRQAAQAGIDHVTVVAGASDGPIADHVRKVGSHLGIEASIAVQEEPRGTGHALRQAELGDEPVLVANADLVLEDGALDELVQAGQTVIGAARVEDVSEYGALETTGDRLTAIREKPEESKPGRINAGVYVMPPQVQDYLETLEESPRGEIELTDAIEAAASAHENVQVHVLEEWLDVGWPWDLLEANRIVLDELTPRLAGKVEEGARVKGPVRVEEGAVVRAGAVIEGPALVRSGATVGPNAYVRGSTTVGPNAKIGHGCEVKNSILFEEAKVPHVSYVGDSLLAERVNLGAGTQVANLRHDDADVTALTPRGPIDTARRKLGVVLGAEAKTGINASLNVGVILGPGETVKPGETVWESRVDG